jgi:hypothetical protein
VNGKMVFQQQNAAAIDLEVTRILGAAEGQQAWLKQQASSLGVTELTTASTKKNLEEGGSHAHGLTVTALYRCQNQGLILRRTLQSSEKGGSLSPASPCVGHNFPYFRTGWSRS